MNDLDRKWAEMIEVALRDAAAAGRDDAADYLRLRAENDRIRSAGIRWLFDSFAALSTDPAFGIAVATEIIEPFSFRRNGANIVGSRLSIRHGVRCLTADAGWTRTPADGFMRGGALAAACISHFGMPERRADLFLIRDKDMTAGWIERKARAEDARFDEKRLRRHFEIFIGD